MPQHDVPAHLVHILPFQDANLFSGMTPAHHLLYDESVTSHLVSSWSPNPVDYASPSML